MAGETGVASRLSEVAPDGYRAETEPDGTVRIVRMTGGSGPSARRAGGVGCLLAIVLVWSALVGCLIAVRMGLFSPAFRVSGGVGELLFWIVLLPLALMDLVFGAALLWMAFGREAWIVRPDILEVRRAMPGRAWSRFFTGARLALLRHTDEDGKESWRLAVRTPSEERVLDRGAPEALRALGAVIAAGTGWVLEDEKE